MTHEPENLLAGHTVLECHDKDPFHALITSIEGHHARSVGPGPVRLLLRLVSLGHLDIGVAYCSVAMTVATTRAPSAAFLVQFPLTGRVALEVDGREYAVPPGAGVVLSPSNRLRRDAAPGWTLAMRIDRGFLRSKLEHRLGRSVTGQLTFHPLLTTNAAEIGKYCLLIAEACERGVASPESSVAAVLEAGLVDLLLDLQPHTHGDSVSDTELAARAERVRAVTDHLHHHPSEPLTVKRLAEVAGCSIRSLQSTFADLCGMSPMEFVRRHRLARARELLEAGDSRTSVYSIAYQTGFAQLGRFAAHYRAMYGESPSETIRRTTQSGPTSI